HQIRVHMTSIGHPVVGDRLYGAPREIRAIASDSKTKLSRTKTPANKKATQASAKAASLSGSVGSLSLDRNFLHAAAIEFTHPRTGKLLSFGVPLPQELESFLERVRG